MTAQPFTVQVITPAQVEQGDRLIVTPYSGKRFGVEVRALHTFESGHRYVSGQTFRIADPTVFFPREKSCESLHSARCIERVIL
jgi:hypothetical protein